MYYLRLDVRRRFLRSSYWICRREALLPEPLQIPLCYESGDNPDFKGGLADVWKGKLGNLHVAAKALRISKTSDLVQVRKVRGVHLLFFSDELTVAHTVVLQGGPDMEVTSPCQRAAAVRRNDDQKPGSVHNGDAVDGEWEHQSISEGASGR